MAAAFIGYSILVTLSGSPPRQLEGVVADVIEQTLVLKNVRLLWNQHHLSEYRVDSSVIADLEVVAEQNGAPQKRAQRAKNKAPVIAVKETSTSNSNHQPEPFVDPAILSFAKPRLQTRQVSKESHPSVHAQPDVVSPVMIADSIKQSPTSSTHHENQGPSARTVTSEAPGLFAVKSARAPDRRGSTATATLTEPFDHMALKEGDGNAVEDADKGASVNTSTKKNRRKSARKTKENVTGPSTMQPQMGNKKTPTKGKGWRQTPLTEAAPPSKSGSKGKRPGHRSRNSFFEDNNGWATEDATDIHDLGDFDFEQNLSKFDKRRVFEDIRKEDNIPTDERLVSFNRKPRPGQTTTRNLHYTENVLEAPSKPTAWKSEAGETEDEAREEHFSSGRTSRRDGSLRPLPSRKTTLRGLKSPSITSPVNGSSSPFRTNFIVPSTNKSCPTLSPLQTIEIEQLCTTELGLTEDILSENAGRGIAQAALSIRPSLSPDQSFHQTINILLLIGNHKTGARAVAAARHLRSHNARTAVVILGGEREDLLHETLKRQNDLYRRAGGLVLRWDEYQTRLNHPSSASTHTTNPSSTTATKPTGPLSSPHLIIDALLATHLTFSELRTDDQALAFEMIRWANRQASTPTPILSIDVPSGLHPAAGTVTQTSDIADPLLIHAHAIACLGAVKTGVRAAIEEGSVGEDWRLLVVDVGWGEGVWRRIGAGAGAGAGAGVRKGRGKGGKRGRDWGVGFGREWVIEVAVAGKGSSYAA